MKRTADQLAYAETPTGHFRIATYDIRRANGDRTSLVLEVGFVGGGYVALRMTKARLRELRDKVSEALRG